VPYSATAHRLLVSTPSDIDADDIRIVFDTINRWNVNYGKELASVVVPPPPLTRRRRRNRARAESNPPDDARMVAGVV
jgi:hypothetical protein